MADVLELMTEGAGLAKDCTAIFDISSAAHLRKEAGNQFIFTRRRGPFELLEHQDGLTRNRSIRVSS